MLTIRLARTGKRNSAQFKIMLQERTVAPGGKHVEILGSYSPHSKEAVLKEERIKYWIEKGAFVSDTVHNLLVKKGVISEKKRVVKIPAKAVEKIEETKKAEDAVVENVAENKDAGKKEEAVKEVEAVAEKIEEAPVAEKKEEIKPVEKIETVEAPKQE